MASQTSPVGKPSILRLRAGLMLVLALLMFCISAGRFVAVQFGLGWVWGTIAAVVIAGVVAFGVTQLTRKTYFLLAAAMTILTTYLAFDFLRGALGWTTTYAFIFALVPFVVLGAAFWDFRKLKVEVASWLNSR